MSPFLQRRICLRRRRNLPSGSYCSYLLATYEGECCLDMSGPREHWTSLGGRGFPRDSPQVWNKLIEIYIYRYDDIFVQQDVTMLAVYFIVRRPLEERESDRTQGCFGGSMG